MTSLLDDIISLAIDGKHPLPDILRKCLLLGHELKNDPLKAWANQELNGYKSKEDVPEYRHIQAIARGHFFGTYGGELKNYPIPPAVLEEKDRTWAREVHLMQGVSGYQELLKASDATTITFPWPGDMVLYYRQKLIDGQGLVSAWLTVSKNAIVEVLDTVRNRTPNVALQIKDELGGSYGDLDKLDSTEADKVQNIIVQNIYGGTSYLSLGDMSVEAPTHIETVINVGDRQKLDELLNAAGLEPADVKKLTKAIEADGGKKPGSKVGNWIKENASQVITGGVKIGAKIGAEILTAWLKQYYGL